MSTCSDIWPSEHEVAETIGEAVRADMFRRSYGEVFDGRRALERAGGARGRALRVGRGLDLRAPAALLPGHARRSPSRCATSHGARVLALLGDSVTTDHISPGRLDQARRPRGRVPAGAGRRAARLQLLRLAPRQPRGDDARHVRQHPPAQPARRRRDSCPKAASPATSATARASRCRSTTPPCATSSEGTDLVVLAGREYGSGSSRDWAAKGTKLLGVRAVIAQSFERIHRSNLVGMGVLPLQFPEGESAALARAERRGDVLDRRARRGDGRRRRAAARGRSQRRARRRRGRSSSTRACASTRRARPSTSATAASCSTSCARCSPHDPAASAKRAPNAAARKRSRQGAPAAAARAARARAGPRAMRPRPRPCGARRRSEFAQVSTDVVGTPLALVAPGARLRGATRRRLLVMGHIDEIGLIVTHIDDEGYPVVPRGRRLGPADPGRPARRARHARRAGARASSARSRSTCCARRSARRSPSIRDLHIDIGARDGEQARGLVRDRRRRRDRRRAGGAAQRAAHLARARQPPRLVRRARGRAPGRRGGRRRVGARGRRRRAGGDHLRRLAHERLLARARRGDRDRRDPRHRRARDRRQGGRQARARLGARRSAAARRSTTACSSCSASRRGERSLHRRGHRARHRHRRRRRAPQPRRRAHGLVSIPIRYMHSPVELVQLDDVTPRAADRRRRADALRARGSFATARGRARRLALELGHRRRSCRPRRAAADHQHAQSLGPGRPCA